MNRYSRDMVKVSVARMLQTIGWHSIQSTPLEMLTDILIQYMTQMAKLTNDYANEFGCIDPNLDHLGLVFREFHISLSELEEYVANVDFGPPAVNIPKYPIPKENHLNFLKPGSKEVVTRPVHIHEHLPPMFTGQEVSETETDTAVKPEGTEDTPTENPTTVFKRPIEVSPGETFKRPRLLMEEEGRPTREISSVIMTTSGYISPAREGKLPESRTPLATIEVAPPPPNSTNVGPPAIIPKPQKVVKKVEKKREKIGKELFKPADDKIKKIPTAKEIAKLKQAKSFNNNINISTTEQLIQNLANNSEIKIIPALPKQMATNRENKTLAAARLKTEKLNTTITPIPMKPTQPPNDNIDKLFTEPDKKKVNILKKISYGKNEKVENKVKTKDEIKQESREGSPVLIIDEPTEQPKVHISSDITIELVDPTPVNKTPEKPEKTTCYDDSPPGTPLTPKTPEISHSPPLPKGKSKRKDKTKVKKVPKVSLSFCNPDNDIDVDVRPKTPEAQLDKHVMLALGLAPYTPGLIPPPVNPFFPNMQLRFPSFGKPPFMPLIPSFPMEFQPSLMKPKEPSIIQPRPPVEKPQPAALPLPPPPPPPVVVVVDDPPPKPEKKTKEHKKDKKDKVKKKNKKDKVKDKAEKKKLKEEKKDKEKIKKEKKEKKKEKELQCREIDSIPKLTLKLGSPTTLAEAIDTRKLIFRNIKPIVKKEEEPPAPTEPLECAPELAKISALVTGQPKPRSTQNNISNDNLGTSSDSFHNQMKKTMFKPIPKKELIEEPLNFGLSNPTPSSYIEELVKDEVQATGPAPRAGPGPGRPRIHPIKPKAVKASKQPPSQHQLPIKDSEGNEVWICPGCDKQDDGSPMIGCDDCDAWYHWVCVGIQVPPDDNENWYCRHCLAKKREVLQTDRKKKRKKREKKEY
ncbi:hypothetical protein Trydic_g21073 [Trypoxylus dichotomus]